MAERGLSEEEIHSLEENVATMRRLFEKGVVTGYIGMDFHVLLAKMSGNPCFGIVVTALRNSLEDITPILKLEGPASPFTLKYHEEIPAAIKDKHPEMASSKMKEHLMDLYERFRETELNNPDDRE